MTTVVAGLFAFVLLAAVGEVAALWARGQRRALLAIGTLGTAITFLLFFEGARRSSAVETALCLQIEPVYSLFLARIFLGHPLTPRRLGAVLAIVGGHRAGAEPRRLLGLDRQRAAARDAARLADLAPDRVARIAVGTAAHALGRALRLRRAGARRRLARDGRRRATARDARAAAHAADPRAAGRRAVVPRHARLVRARSRASTSRAAPRSWCRASRCSRSARAGCWSAKSRRRGSGPAWR